MRLQNRIPQERNCDVTETMKIYKKKSDINEYVSEVSDGLTTEK